MRSSRFYLRSIENVNSFTSSIVSPKHHPLKTPKPFFYRQLTSSSPSSPNAPPYHQYTGVGQRLLGKTIVVCGAANSPDEEYGIGKTTAIVCAREGANVVAVSRDPTRVEATAEAIRQDPVVAAAREKWKQEGKGVVPGGRALGVAADCTSIDDVQRILSSTIDEFGPVDSLINAGVYDFQPNGFVKMDPERWQKSINLNLNAHYNLIHIFLPSMSISSGGNGGTILFVSTIAASHGLGIGLQRHGYAAGKSAASTLTRRIGVEYARDGIRGNVIEAGYIASPLVKRLVDAVPKLDLEEVTAKRGSHVPGGVQGTPIDVAYACAWLASDEAGFINGAVLTVDGGTSSATYGP